MRDDAGHESTEVVSRAWPKRWWRDLRWITAGVITISLAFLAWGLFGPEPPIRVSRETTYFTEPLAADGLPDYRDAILAMEGPKPPPEENAAAGLLQVCWPLGIPDSHLPAVCEALGIQCVAPEQPLREPHRDAASKVSRDDFEASLEQPWTSADLPELSAWLGKNEAAIDQVVAACDRPRYWLPSPSLLRKDAGLLVELLLQSPTEIRQATAILTCRAMWHLGEARHAEAWRDVRAIYRLGRLFVTQRRSQFVTDSLIAGKCEASAYGVMTHVLLADDALARDVLAEIRRDLDSVGRSGSFTEFLQVERATSIDALVFIGYRSPGGRAGRVDSFKSWGGSDQGLDAVVLRTSIDWNDILKSVNEVFDRQESTRNLPTYAERRESFRRARSDFVDRAKSWTGAGGAFMVLCNRGARSDYLGARLGIQVMPDFSSTLDLIARTQAQFVLVQTAAALAAWRLDPRPDGKEYPERLDELVPKYLPALPIDPFSDKPLVYERRDDGYLLVSTDWNCVYDGGTSASGWIFKGEWQDERRDCSSKGADYDLVVRMPVPKRPFAQRETP